MLTLFIPFVQVNLRKQNFCIFSPFDVDSGVLALTGGGVANAPTGVSLSENEFQQSKYFLSDLNVSL